MRLGLRRTAAGAAIAAASLLGAGAILGAGGSNVFAYGPTSTTAPSVTGSVDPVTVSCNGDVTVTVKGPASATYTIFLDSGPGAELGTQTANSAGVAVGTYPLPNGTALGAHTVFTYHGGVEVFSEGITVTACPTTATTTSSLPLTGTDVALTGGLAAVAIGAGGLLVLSSRKRRRQAWTESAS